LKKFDWLNFNREVQGKSIFFDSYEQKVKKTLLDEI